jgi:hypothetical protein
MKMIAPLGAILDAMRPALVDLAKNSNTVMGAFKFV